MPPIAGESADLEDLWRLSCGGDNAAFERLYRAAVGPVFGLCLRMAANPAHAEECAQKTFIRAWQHRAEFRGDSKITTWLHRIAVNEVLSTKRRETRYKRAMDEWGANAELESAFPSSPDLDLERAISELPERARQVFVLRAIYGYAHEETAAMLDIAIGTSKAHYHKARHLLHDALGDSHDHAD